MMPERRPLYWAGKCFFQFLQFTQEVRTMAAKKAVKKAAPKKAAKKKAKGSRCCRTCK